MRLFKKKAGDPLALFVFPSIGGPAPYFRNLQTAVGEGFDLVQLDRRQGNEPYPRSPQEVGRLHLEQIRQSGRSGPYALIGHSYGAQAAYYTAVALREAREKVAFVGLIDDEADVHRRRFNINAAQCAGDDPVVTGRHVVDVNPLYRYPGKLTLIKADIWSGMRMPGPASDWEFLAESGVDVFTHPFMHSTITSVEALGAWGPQLRVALARAAGRDASYPDGLGPTFVPSRVRDIPQEAIDAYRASKAGDLAAEIAGYRQALATAPTAPDWIAVNLSVALRQNGKPDAAIGMLQSVTGGSAVLGNAQVELVNLYNATGRHADRSRLAGSVASLPCATASDWHFKGVLLELCHRFDDAIAAFQTAIDLQAERSDSRYRCAFLLKREGRFREAQEIIEEGLRLDADSGFLRVLLGEVQLASGSRDEAEASFRHVIETDPSKVRAVLSFAQMLMNEARLEEAAELVDATLTRHASNHGLCLINAELRVLTGEKAAAEAAFRKAIDLQNQDIRPWIGLAKLMAGDNRSRDALDLLRSAPQQVQQTGAVRMQAGDIALSDGGP